jgi:hypothetical protein
MDGTTDVHHLRVPTARVSGAGSDGGGNAWSTSPTTLSPFRPEATPVREGSKSGEFHLGRPRTSSSGPLTQGGPE